MRKPAALLASMALFASLPLAGQGAREIPEPTPLGAFAGTWFYVDPAFKIALFISHDKAGLLTMRYHVSTKGGSEFETDAGGYAKYADGGTVVEILFKGSPNPEETQIDGAYERTATTPEATLTESGEFRLYRAYKGRNLVLFYPEYKTEVTQEEGRPRSSIRPDVMTIFRKASDVVLDFDEIPF